MPSPGPLGHNPNYMDLIGDTKVPDTLIGKTGRYIPDFVPVTSQSQSRCGVDNLEYHLMHRDHDYVNSMPPHVNMKPHQPQSSQTNVPLGGTQISNNMYQQHHPVHFMGPRKIEDIEEMSDEHDYYNEYDRLQRELQPLRSRNETTV